ncbi:MAG: atpA [Patescibacteria group bacterium]|jgi:F-type H+-transporting ATPase subunit alpha|nr:atpA [Patescibacteria group bacterium]
MNSIGKVIAVADDIVHVSGLQEVALDNVIQFSSGIQGVVFGFDPQEVLVVSLGGKDIKKGDLARVVAPSLMIPVGEDFLGRTVNPLGVPLDGRPVPESKESRPYEAQAKQINDRRHITSPLPTGFLSIDSQVPVGRGQRELLIGSRGIDKGDVAAAIIGSQVTSKTGVIGIYVTVDAQTAVVKRRIAQLERYGAMQQSIVMVGRASDGALLNYIAPMAAMTMAEWFADRGKEVLVIFDSLTQHAKVYRQLSLLLGRSPGREAYPGDVFYLHSRLLERAGHFSEAVGAGSITALPLVDTQGEEITDYITTNLMSITDGHILFSLKLANEGIRPAVDTGFSVSRIGGRAQHPVLRKFSDQLRFLIIRYQELEQYSSFGSELQGETVTMLRLGKSIYQCMHQDVDELLSTAEQIILLHAITSREILKWAVEKITTLRAQLLEFLRAEAQAPKIEKILAAKGLDEAMPDIKALWEEFTAVPHIVKQEEEVAPSQAEKETVIDLLRDFPGEQNATDRDDQGES